MFQQNSINLMLALDNIKVPILNDDTGDVVFLEMGDIDFRPQLAGLPGNNFDFGEPSLPEQIFLKRTRSYCN